MKVAKLALTLSVGAALSFAYGAERLLPEYLKRATVYQMVLRNFTHEGTFRAATDMLEHVRSAGVDVVYLIPFVEMDLDKGETLTATSPSGVATAVVSSPASDGTVDLPQGAGGPVNAGGIWNFANSNGAHARIGIAWAVFDDGGTLAETAAGTGFIVDASQTGPDRKLKKSEVPPVAYSGDDWTGDLSKAATITFTSPGGSATTWSKAGTGADTFTFSERGTWKVELWYEGSDASGDPDATAKIDISTGGFMLIIR